MNILYLCHRFPFPPKRGGKIRPFNMIRHLTGQRHRVTVCSLARSPQEAEEGRGIAPHCARFEMGQVSDPVQTLRDGRSPAAADALVDGLFLLAVTQTAVDACWRTERWDLIFVHCSSVAQYVEHVRDVPKILDFGDMDSQKWLEYAHYKPFPLSLGYRLEGNKVLAAEKRLARRFDLCTATTRAEWETLEGYRHRRGHRLVSEWRRRRVLLPVRWRTLRPRHVSFIGRMDYYPNQECMARFCDQIWPQLRTRRPQMKLLIVGADPLARDAQTGRAAGRHRHRLGARRAALHSPVGADGGAAQHRPRHAEQDPRSDGHGRARGHQPRSLPAVSMPRPRSISWWPTAHRNIAVAVERVARQSVERQRLAHPAVSACSATMPGRARCNGWTASSIAACENFSPTPT
jgi:hypothetical protein